MRIAVIGAGRVGTALGERWAAVGHEVTYGVRDANSSRTLRGRTAPVADAVRGSETVLLATPWDQTIGAVRAMGDVRGKTIIDATNPLVMGPRGLALDPAASPSGAAMIAAAAPGAHVVKAFNQTGFENMANAEKLAARPLMLIASDNEASRAAAGALASGIGFEAVDAGPLANAVHLEHVAYVWIDLVFRRGQPRDTAFALVRSR